MKTILPKLASLAAATLISATMLSATAPQAYASGSAQYRLTTAEAVAGTHVARDTLWRCDANGCSAASATSRPAIVCALAAREIGKLESFSVRGEAFDAEALEKCNSRAR